MILVTFSVVVTIGVLNVNFRTPATHKVSLPLYNSYKKKLEKIYGLKIRPGMFRISQLYGFTLITVCLEGSQSFKN